EKSLGTLSNVTVSPGRPTCPQAVTRGNRPFWIGVRLLRHERSKRIFDCFPVLVSPEHTVQDKVRLLVLLMFRLLPAHTTYACDGRRCDSRWIVSGELGCVQFLSRLYCLSQSPWPSRVASPSLNTIR